MADFNPLNFIANHAGMNLADAIKEAYEQGKRDAQPKTGKWEAVKRSDGVSIDFRCSACHRFRFHNGELRRYKYCPNCGCRMMEGD